MMSKKNDKTGKSMGIEYAHAREKAEFMPAIKEPEPESSDGIERGSNLWALGLMKRGVKVIGFSTSRYEAYMREDGKIILNGAHEYTEEEWLQNMPDSILWEPEEDI